MPDAHDAISRIAEGQAEQEPPKYQLLTHQELVDLDIPPMEWIISKLIPNPGLVVISGKPGSFKTFFAQWLGLRVSGGRPLFDLSDQPFLRRPSAMGQIPTLFIEEEMTKQLMKERALNLNVPGVDGMFYMIDDGFKFKDELWRTEILKVIEEKKIKLLILDPFSSVMGLENENDNAEVAKVMDIIRKEFVKIGLTVVLIHHPSKGEGESKNIRGAGDILGKCDVHICLETKEESGQTVIVSIQKNRVADRSIIKSFAMNLAGTDSERNQRFEYLGEKKPEVKGHIKVREELAEEILEAVNDGEERHQKDIAKLVGQKANNKKFEVVWSKLLQEKRLLKSATTKMYHIPLNLPPPQPPQQYRQEPYK